jgi:hypothetical protein
MKWVPGKEVMGGGVDVVGGEDDVSNHDGVKLSGGEELVA